MLLLVLAGWTSCILVDAEMEQLLTISVAHLDCVVVPGVVMRSSFGMAVK
jgi:hypothetical protein